MFHVLYFIGLRHLKVGSAILEKVSQSNTDVLGCDSVGIALNNNLFFSMMPDHMFRIRMSHTVHMVYDRYLSIAMASSIVLASTVPSSGTILFTFSSSGISRWLSFVGGNFV